MWVGGDADLVPVGRGHPDDRVDGVVVDEEGEEQEPRVLVDAQLAERPGQAARRDPDRALAAGLRRFEPSGGLGDLAEERDGEEHPPHGDAQERQPRRGARVRDAEALRVPEHGHVQGEEEAAAEVAQGEAGGRDAVHLVGGRDRREQRVVEGQGGGDGDVADHEGREGEAPLPLRDEVHGGGGGGAEGEEGAQEELLAAAVVGDRPEQGAEQADQDHGERRGEGEARARHSAARPDAATFTKKSGKTAVITVVIQAELATS